MTRTHLSEHRKHGFIIFRHAITRKLNPGGFGVESDDQPANIWTCLCFCVSAHSQVEASNLRILLRFKLERPEKVVLCSFSHNKCLKSPCNEHKLRFPVLRLKGRNQPAAVYGHLSACHSSVQPRTQGALCCTWPLLCKYTLSDCQQAL